MRRRSGDLDGGTQQAARRARGCEYHELAAEVLGERKAVLAGGLPGASTGDALGQAGVDPAGYLTISVSQILVRMAERSEWKSRPSARPSAARWW